MKYNKSIFELLGNKYWAVHKESNTVFLVNKGFYDRNYTRFKMGSKIKLPIYLNRLDNLLKSQIALDMTNELKARNIPDDLINDYIQRNVINLMAKDFKRNNKNYNLI